MSQISIRQARREDVPIILGFVRELAEYERGLHLVAATEGMLDEALFGARPACEALIGEIDGLAKGLALFFHNFSTWTGRRGIYLEDLYVTPDSRGKGLGKALFVHLAGIAVERDCARMEWSVIDWNVPAIEFYKSLGAVPMSEWTIHRLSGEGLSRLGASAHA